jgi:hypothetical protein
VAAPEFSRGLTPRLNSNAADAADESWPVLQEVDEYLTLDTHLQTAVKEQNKNIRKAGNPYVTRKTS